MFTSAINGVISMLWALNAKHKAVLIYDAAPSRSDDLFFCPRCGAKLILVVPQERSAYFRHYANEACDFKGDVMSSRDFQRIFPDGDEAKPQPIKIWCERKQAYVWMLHTIRTFSLMRSRFNSICFREGLKRDFSRMNGQMLSQCQMLVIGHE